MALGDEMNLTAHFTLEELTHSNKAVLLNLDNTPSPEIIKELKLTAEMLEKIRAHISALCGRDCPMFDISGYRSLLVNRAVGSSDTSDHVKGAAADFEAAWMKPYDVCKALVPKMAEFGIGQIINEKTWVHVSRHAPANAVNRILTIDSRGTMVGIV